MTQALALQSRHIPNSIYTREEVSRHIVDLWAQDWSEMEDIAAQVTLIMTDSSHVCLEAAM